MADMQMAAQTAGGCSDAQGTLPACAPLANPYVPFQNDNPERYAAGRALMKGTLFPGLDLPYRGAQSVEPRSEEEMQRLQELQDELTYLKTVREKEVAELIKEARGFGDLSENSEYDEAKNTQGLVENRITELEQMVKNAVVIDESELSVESVSVGTHVTIQMAGEDEKEEYDVVGRTEADPLNGKISDESPVGHALLGKAVGEKAEVLLPSGHTVEYTVLSIAHSIN